MPSSPPVIARIYTESGGWSLPTLDADALAAIALLRFADIPFTIRTGASAAITSANTLPVVIFERPQSSEPSVCAGLASLIALLTADRSLPDPNRHLTPFMIAESTAFATLITSRFGPARQHELFMDDRNYADIYHSLLEKDSRFPFNRVLPWVRRRQIRSSLAGKTAETLYFDAGIALAALSTRLGDRNKFFYGDQPSVLDAVVFGYLAPVLYIPLPSTELRGQVAKFSNLVAFVGRVRQMYFTRDGERLMGELDNEALVEERRRQVERESSRQTQNETQKEEDLSETERERRQWNRYFIWGSVGVFLTHILLGTELEFEVN